MRGRLFRIRNYKRFTVIVSAAGFVLFFALLALLFATPYLKWAIVGSNSERYERDWQIFIPSDFVEAAHYASEDGEGGSFTVYVASDGEFSSLMGGKSGDWASVSYHSGYSPFEKDKLIKTFVESVAEDLEVDSDSIPQFDRSFYWKLLSRDEGRLAILYFPDTRRAYFAEKTN